MFGERVVLVAGHDEVVDDLDVDECQAGLELLGEPLIRRAGLCTATGVVVRESDRSSVMGERSLDHFAGVDRGLGQRPPKELFDGDQPVLRIQVDDEEDLVVEGSAVQAQSFGQQPG